MTRILRHTAPLIILDILLLVPTLMWAGMRLPGLLSLRDFVISALVFPVLFLLCLAAASVIESIWRVREFVQEETGQVNLHALRNSNIFKLNPWPGAVVSLLMGMGVAGCANLVEIYRTSVAIWHDNVLWSIEEPLFSMLLGSWVDFPAAWDKVYFILLPFLFLAMACIFKAGRQQRLLEIAMAVVIAFYLTRFINLLLPTAGPAFYRPELFNLAGTASQEAQDLLRAYMAGLIKQNGVFPGTMAMPSLHVGLTAFSAWVLGREWRWTLWLTIPWLLLIWMSTIMLGWHYALDGVGGIIVIGISVFMARNMLNLWNSFPRLKFA